MPSRIFPVTIDRLHIHPNNMYRVFNPAEVRQMAASIKANGGVLQPLRVFSMPGRRGHYYVEDGNLRVTAGQTLGAHCPPLDCILSRAGSNRLQQGLNMVTANKVRRRGDPISEARHYQWLMKEHGLTVTAIARRTGLPRVQIDNCLIWLRLEDDIQLLVLEGQLPSSPSVARALLTLPSGAKRVMIARKLAETSATIKMIEDFCRRFNERRKRSRRTGKASRSGDASSSSAADPAADEPITTPALTLAVEGNGRITPDGQAVVAWADVRATLRGVCQACDLYEADLHHNYPEPAWSLLAHAAGQTCAQCSLPKLRSVCGGCPAVEVLKRVIENRKTEASHEPV